MSPFAVVKASVFPLTIDKVPVSAGLLFGVKVNSVATANYYKFIIINLVLL